MQAQATSPGALRLPWSPLGAQQQGASPGERCRGCLGARSTRHKSNRLLCWLPGLCVAEQGALGGVGSATPAVPLRQAPTRAACSSGRPRRRLRPAPHPQPALSQRPSGPRLPPAHAAARGRWRKSLRVAKPCLPYRPLLPQNVSSAWGVRTFLKLEEGRVSNGGGGGRGGRRPLRWPTAPACHH